MSTKNPAGWDQRRILLVAMVDSIHVARWIAQFEGTNTEFVVFPSTPNRRIHPMIQARLKDSSGSLRVTLASSMRWLSLPLGVLDLVLGHRLKGFFLRRFARGEHFDFVHVLELQHAGYIAVKAWGDSSCPAPLIVTNWGSDIFWFQQFPKHQDKIRRLLQLAQFYSAECLRDWALARELGFVGACLPVIPNAGGLHLEGLLPVTQACPPSARRRVVVKGYSRFVGLAPLALRAIEATAADLGGYEVVVYSASLRVRWLVRQLARRSGLAIRAIRPHAMSHDEMLALFASSRVYLGLSKSDGISTSLLEAMTVGCFPIQTDTSCADEWIVHGTTGAIVDYHAAGDVSSWLRNALVDDALVDSAMTTNQQTIKQRASSDRVAQISQTYYASGA